MSSTRLTKPQRTPIVLRKPLVSTTLLGAALLALAMPTPTTLAAGSSPKAARTDSLVAAGGTEQDPTLPVEVESTGRRSLSESSDGWYARYLRAPQTVACLGQSDAQCREQRLEVTSESKGDLVCKTLMPLPDGTNEERRTLVPPGRTKAVAEAFLPADQTLKLRTVSCEALPSPPPPNPAPPSGCRPEIFAGPSVDAFYPDLSRRLQEEGPVAVYFRLEQEEGPATHIRVGQSSLSAQLDEAAMLYIANQTFRVSCPKHEFRLRVRFRLQDEAKAP